MVAFDGDDTLWHSESHFVDAHARYVALLAPYVDDRSERRSTSGAWPPSAANLAIYGYGAKAFTLSLIETAIDLTGGRVTSDEISAHPRSGQGPAGPPGRAARRRRRGRSTGWPTTAVDLIVVTKGDLFHQEAKVAGSGLADRFARVEIVSEKDMTTYRRVIGEAGVDPSTFLMIGNSVRSDMLPVVELGGHAVHLPYVYTWELEQVPTPTPSARATTS